MNTGTAVLIFISIYLLAQYQVIVATSIYRLNRQFMRLIIDISTFYKHQFFSFLS
jgi:hypothetical protein